ncbi:MAG: hypothetical protein KC910_19245, partial [Candidatus Eremiobacteraeota bacterium]|nr:hypothetical protein [Candidatus Eremiobacteraeota bacterium]
MKRLTPFLAFLLLLGGGAFARDWPKPVLQHSHLTSWGDADEARSGAFFGPDGRYLITSLDYLKLWDGQGHLLADLIPAQPQSNTFHELAFLDDERCVSMGKLSTRGGEVGRPPILWDLRHAREIGPFDCSGNPQAMAVSPDQKTLWLYVLPAAGGGVPELQAWNIDHRSLSKTWKLAQSERLLALNGSYLLSQPGADGPHSGYEFPSEAPVMLRRLSKPDSAVEMTRLSHHYAQSTTFSPNGKLALVECRQGAAVLDLEEGKARLLELFSQRQEWSAPQAWNLDDSGRAYLLEEGLLRSFPGQPRTLPPGQPVAVTADGTCFVQAGDVLKVVGAQAAVELGRYRLLAVSGRVAAVMTQLGQISTYDLQEPGWLHRLGQHLDRNDGAVAIGTDLMVVPNLPVDPRLGYSVELWNLSQGRLVERVEGRFLAGSSQAVLLDQGDQLKRWFPRRGHFDSLGPAAVTGALSEDGATYAVLRSNQVEYQHQGQTGRLNLRGETLELSPGGRFLLVQDDEQSTLVDLESGRALGSIPGMTHMVADDQLVWATSDRFGVRWLDGRTVEQKIDFQPSSLICDQGMVVLGGNHQAAVFDLLGRQLCRLEGATRAFALVDGRVIAENGIWDATSGQRLASFEGGPGTILPGSKVIVHHWLA